MQILENNETMGREFYCPPDKAFVEVTGHAGGTWTLEKEAPNGEWLCLDVTFKDSGSKAFYTDTRAKYRINGGNVGAQAFLKGAD